MPKVEGFNPAPREKLAGHGYRLDNQKPLDDYVESIIEKHTSRFISEAELKAASTTLNVDSVLSTLPEGIGVDDFTGILKLAMLTECATDTYASVFTASAKKYNVPALGRFNQDFWVPDEYSHHVPYKNWLMQLGFSEESLDAEIKQSRNATFEHGIGYSPVQATTFGIVQELLTDNYHGLIADLLKPSSPEAARMSNRVKARETLHKVAYKDMTKIQIAGNPDLIDQVARPLVEFKLPGNYVAPDQQRYVRGWMEKMGNDESELKQRVITDVVDIAVTTENMGQLAIDVAALKGFKIDTKVKALPQIPVNSVRWAIALMPGGFQLVGEAVQQSLGIKIDTQGEEESMVGRFKKKLRNQIAGELNQIDFAA